jgi:hypothetical protein
MEILILLGLTFGGIFIYSLACKISNDKGNKAYRELQEYHRKMGWEK